MAAFSLRVLRAESREVKGTKGTQHPYLALCRWRGIFSYLVNPLGCELCPLKANTPFGEREQVVSKKSGVFCFVFKFFLYFNHQKTTDESQKAGLK